MAQDHRGSTRATGSISTYIIIAICAVSVIANLYFFASIREANALLSFRGAQTPQFVGATVLKSNARELTLRLQTVEQENAVLRSALGEVEEKLRASTSQGNFVGRITTATQLLRLLGGL